MDMCTQSDPQNADSPMKKSKPVSTRINKAGFSLHELMISMVIAVFVLSAIMFSFVQNNYVFTSQRLQIETLQNSRASLDQISRDVRTAGYGLAVLQYPIDAWVKWIPGIDSNPFVVQGEQGEPDELYVIAAFDGPVAHLSSDHVLGTTVLHLNFDTDRMPFDLEQHYLVYIGKTEMARITAFTSSGIVVSTEPVGSHGMRIAHEAGTPVELIKTVHYSIDEFNNRPFLSRNDSGENYTQPLNRMCAGNIENLQVTRSQSAVEIVVEARSMRLDARHVDHQHGDHYRRHQLVSRVASRNLLDPIQPIPRSQAGIYSESLASTPDSE